MTTLSNEQEGDLNSETCPTHAGAIPASVYGMRQPLPSGVRVAVPTSSPSASLLTESAAMKAALGTATRTTDSSAILTFFRDYTVADCNRRSTVADRRLAESPTSAATRTTGFYGNRNNKRN